MGEWFFLTAYDPSDLPGGSIDPLGFERGYLFLADKILPGMTNVANCPRYFEIICSGILLAATPDDLPPKTQYAERQDAILRMERLWALSNVLATEKESSLSGLRGVTYAQRQAERLKAEGRNKTNIDYKLLSRQVPYGAIGIYGAVAEYMKLIYRSTFELTPGLGLRLAEAFSKSTSIPNIIKKAVRNGGEVSLNVLRDWGEKSYLWNDMNVEERSCVYEMLHGDPIRSNSIDLLRAVSFSASNDTELKRLGRLSNKAKSNGLTAIAESADGIRLYEECYRYAMLGMERLLFLCNANGGSVSKESISSDEILGKVCEKLPASVGKLNRHFSDATSEHFLSGSDSRLKDIRYFMNIVVGASESQIELAEAIVSRHADVQHGKFDRGRRKMPWIQWQNNSLVLTMAKITSSNKQITDPEQIAPHPYRLSAADSWIKAAYG